MLVYFAVVLVIIHCVVLVPRFFRVDFPFRWVFFYQIGIVFRVDFCVFLTRIVLVILLLCSCNVLRFCVFNIVYMSSLLVLYLFGLYFLFLFVFSFVHLGFFSIGILNIFSPCCFLHCYVLFVIDVLLFCTF